MKKVTAMTQEGSGAGDRALRGVCKMTSARRDNILRRNFFGIVAITVALLSPVDTSAQKVKFEFDKATNFAPLKTYAWIPGTAANNPNVNFYIMSAIDHYFEPKGLTKVTAKQADFVITYHAARDTELNATGIDSASYAVSMGLPADSSLSWITAWSTYPYATGTARYIRKGTLVLEVIDRERRQLIWTATTTVTLDDKRSKAWDQLDQVLIKMAAGYPPPAP